MKIKTVLIWVCAGAALVGGGVLAAKRVAVSSRKAVEVMPVVNADLAIQYASWGFDSDESMYGMIVSKDTQKVDLSIGNGKTLKKVYVSEGDAVKSGDILLEYDVRKKELEREAHDLALQLSKLELTRLETELETLRQKNPGLFAELEAEEKTASVQYVDQTALAQKIQATASNVTTISGNSVLPDSEEGTALLKGLSAEDTDSDALLTDSSGSDNSAGEAVLSDGLLSSESAGVTLRSDDLLSSENAGGPLLSDGFLTQGSAAGTLLSDDLLSRESSGGTSLSDGFLTRESSGGTSLSNGFLSRESARGTSLSDVLLSSESAGESLLEDGFLLEEETEDLLSDGLLDDEEAVGILLADGFLTDEETGGTLLSDDLLTNDEAGDALLSDGLLTDEETGDALLTDGIASADEAGGTSLLDGLLADGTALESALLDRSSDEEDSGLSDDILGEDADGSSEEDGLEDGIDDAGIDSVDSSSDILDGEENSSSLDDIAGGEDGFLDDEADEELLEASENETDTSGYSDDEEYTQEDDEEYAQEDDEEDAQEDDEEDADEDDDELEKMINEAVNFTIGQVDTSELEAEDLNGENTTDMSAEEEKIEDNLLDFLRVVNLLTRQYTENPLTLKWDDLYQAYILYETQLAREVKTSPFLDALGEERSASLFVPGTMLLRTLQDMEEKYSDFSASDTLKAVHQAYANYLYYRLVYEVQNLQDLLGSDASQISADIAQTAEGQIRDAADAYYKLYFFWRYLKESVPKLAKSSSLFVPLPDVYLDELKQGLLSYATDGTRNISDELFASYPILGGGYGSYLSNLVDILLGNSFLENESVEEETEAWTEDYYDDDFDDYDDDESSEDLSSELLDKLIAVRTQRVNVRQAELDLKKDDEEIEKATVRASLDGVVRAAGTLEEGTRSEEGFIVVAGEMGMYAVGSISEMERDTICVGDVVTGTSEESGQEFTAKITEIMDYPTTDGNDDYYFYSYSSEVTNSNASEYQFYAYIEDTTGLEEGYATLQFEKEAADTTGIMLEDYFVREEEDGKTYVYIRGDKDQIKKQYVTVGKGSLFGSGKNIIEGLDYEDLIAFPADSIREGDPTTEVDFLEDVYY